MSLPCSIMVVVVIASAFFGTRLASCEIASILPPVANAKKDTTWYLNPHMNLEDNADCHDDHLGCSYKQFVGDIQKYGGRKPGCQDGSHVVREAGRKQQEVRTSEQYYVVDEVLILAPCDEEDGTDVTFIFHWDTSPQFRSSAAKYFLLVKGTVRLKLSGTVAGFKNATAFVKVEEGHRESKYVGPYLPTVEWNMKVRQRGTPTQILGLSERLLGACFSNELFPNPWHLPAEYRQSCPPPEFRFEVSDMECVPRMTITSGYYADYHECDLRVGFVNGEIDGLRLRSLVLSPISTKHAKNAVVSVVDSVIGEVSVNNANKDAVLPSVHIQNTIVGSLLELGRIANIRSVTVQSSVINGGLRLRGINSIVLQNSSVYGDAVIFSRPRGGFQLTASSVSGVLEIDLHGSSNISHRGHRDFTLRSSKIAGGIVVRPPADSFFLTMGCDSTCNDNNLTVLGAPRDLCSEEESHFALEFLRPDSSSSSTRRGTVVRAQWLRKFVILGGMSICPGRCVFLKGVENFVHEGKMQGGGYEIDLASVCPRRSVKILVTSVRSCVSPDRGGGVALFNSDKVSRTVDVFLDRIQNCSALYGGGIFVDEKLALRTHTSVSQHEHSYGVFGNTAYGGGGIFVASLDLPVETLIPLREVYRNNTATCAPNMLGVATYLNVTRMTQEVVQSANEELSVPGNIMFCLEVVLFHAMGESKAWSCNDHPFLYAYKTSFSLESDGKRIRGKVTNCSERVRRVCYSGVLHPDDGAKVLFELDGRTVGSQWLEPRPHPRPNPRSHHAEFPSILVVLAVVSILVLLCCVIVVVVCVSAKKTNEISKEEDSTSEEYDPFDFMEIAVED